MSTDISFATGRRRLFGRVRRARRHEHLIAVPNLTRSLRREARNEGRRDAATEPLLAPPSPYQQRLQRECDYAIRADLEERIEEVGALRGAIAGNRLMRDERSEQLEGAPQALEDLEENLGEHPRPLWPGRIGWTTKWILLLSLGGFEYTLIRVALDALVLDDIYKNLVALLIGVVPIIAIELNAAQLLEALSWHKEDLSRRRAWALSFVALMFIGVSVFLFLVSLGVVRAQGFAAGGIIEDMPTGFGTALAISLALLQAVALVAAVALTRQHAAADGWRYADDNYSALEGQIADWEAELLGAEAEHAEMVERIKAFGEIVEQHHLSIVDYFGAREACYRLILNRIHPKPEESFDVWPAWKQELLKELNEKDYKFFDWTAEPGEVSHVPEDDMVAAADQAGIEFGPKETTRGPQGTDPPADVDDEESLASQSVTNGEASERQPPGDSEPEEDDARRQT